MPSLGFRRQDQKGDTSYAKRVVRVTSSQLTEALGLEELWKKALSTAQGAHLPHQQTLANWKESFHRRMSDSDPPQNLGKRQREQDDSPWTPGQAGQAPASTATLLEDDLLQPLADYYDGQPSEGNARSTFYNSANNSIPGSEDSCYRLNPEAVLLHPSCEGKAAWPTIRSLIEFTTTIVTDTDHQGIHPKVMQLILNLYTCLYAQPTRQYVVGISMHMSKEKKKGAGETTANACYAYEVIAVTRSQILVVCQADTFTEAGLTDLGAWLNLLRTADLQEHGHLPSFVRSKGPTDYSGGSCRVFELDRKTWRISSCVQATADSPFSRAASAWRVQEVQHTAQPISSPTPPSQQQLVLKMFWPHALDMQTQDDATFAPEVLVLGQLKCKAKDSPSLRARVPILQASGILGGAIGYQNPLPRQPVAIICEGEGQRISNSSLPTLRDLVDFLIDLWEGYGDILEAGVAHKDLSLNNAMVRRTDTGSAGAFFIDFGASILINKNFEPRADWASRAHMVTMTPDCASFAGVVAGDTKHYRFSVRQELESLLNLVYRIVLHLSPHTRPSRHKTAGFSIVTPRQSPRTTPEGAGAASYSTDNVVSTPSNLSGWDPSDNVHLRQTTQRSVSQWIRSLTHDERKQSPADLLDELVELLSKLDQRYNLHPSPDEQTVWFRVAKGGAYIPAEYLATDRIKETIQEVVRCINAFKCNLTESQLDLSFTSSQAPRSSKISSIPNGSNA